MLKGLELKACLLALLPSEEREHTLGELSGLVNWYLKWFEGADFKTDAERFVKVHVFLAGFRGHFEELHQDDLDEEEGSCQQIPGYSISLPGEIQERFLKTFQGSPRLRDAFDLGTWLDQGIRPSIEHWSVFVRETRESDFHLESKRPCELPPVLEWSRMVAGLWSKLNWPVQLPDALGVHNPTTAEDLLSAVDLAIEAFAQGCRPSSPLERLTIPPERAVFRPIPNPDQGLCFTLLATSPEESSMIAVAGDNSIHAENRDETVTRESTSVSTATGDSEHCHDAPIAAKELQRLRDIKKKLDPKDQPFQHGSSASFRSR